MSNIQINIKNYEEFALDYLEGNLSEHTRASFDLFLSKNPTIEEELSNLLDYRVEPTALIYNEKDKLKKRTGIGRYGILGFFTLGAGVILLIAFVMSSNIDDQGFSSTANNHRTQNVHNSLNAAPATADTKKPDLLDKTAIDTTKTESVVAASSINVEVPYAPKPAVKRSTAKKKASSVEKKSVTTSTHVYENKKLIHTSIQKDTPMIESSPSEKKDLEKNTKMLPHQQMIKSNENASSKNINRSITSVITEDENSMDTINEDIALMEQGSIPTIDVAHVDTIKILKTAAPIRIAPLEKTSDVALARALNESLPTIIIPDEKLDNIEVIAAVDNDRHEDVRKNKKFKLRFRNFLPEQFAGLTKEDIKRSLIPETFTAR